MKFSFFPLMLLLVCLFPLCSYGLIAYQANTDPQSQDWSLVKLGTPLLNGGQENIGGDDYFYWNIDNTSTSQRARYEDTSTLTQNFITHADGWTVTWVVRVIEAEQKGSCWLRLRDGDKYWQIDLIQSATNPLDNGLWIDFDTPRQVCRADLSDTYHTIQLVHHPANPGSYDDDDLVNVYLDGQLVYFAKRRDNPHNTAARWFKWGDNEDAGEAHFRTNYVGVVSGDQHEAALWDVGSQKQLFMDTRFIDTSTHVQLKTQYPQETSEKLIVQDQPWEANWIGFYFSTLQEDNVLKMWYLASYISVSLRNLAYAYSTDGGATWIKPALGVIEFDGSTANNLVMEDIHSTQIFHNAPDAPASQRYCQFTGSPNKAFYSEDGFVWTQTGAQPFLDMNGYYGLDSQNAMFYDDRLDHYVTYPRVWVGAVPNGTRCAARLASDTFGDFPPVTADKIVIQPDDFDPPNMDFYCTAAFKYPYAQDVYVMFPSMFYRQPVDPMEGPLAIHFGHSRDGIFWQRPLRIPVITSGFDPDGEVTDEWENYQLYAGYGLTRHDDELSVYYSSRPCWHSTPPPPNSYGGIITRAKYRLDGFVSADFSAIGAALTTPRLTFSGDKLVLNVDAVAASSARVELRDVNNTPIPGYTLSDCNDFAGIDDVEHTVMFNGDYLLSGVPDTVRLHFVMDNAELYAFQFQESEPQGVTLVEYTPPGTPGNQGWTVDERDGVVTGDLNDIAYGFSYPAWSVVNSVEGQRAWYLKSVDDPELQQAMLDGGWTLTYITCTHESYARGAHHIKVRDGANYFDPYFLQLPDSGDNGFWIRLSDGDYQLAAMALDDDYHIFQMMLTPANPGSYDPCDLIEMYVDGEKVFQFTRDRMPSGTGLWRNDFGDFATGGKSNFAVNLFRLETGRHVTNQPFRELTLSTDPPETRLADNTTPHAYQPLRARKNAVIDISAQAERDTCPWMDFDHWTGATSDPCSSVTTVTLNADTTVTADFTPYDHLCGDACTPPDQLLQRGDLNTDCIVDFLDAAKMLTNWLAEYDASSFVD